jgi:clan AA aspartic protease
MISGIVTAARQPVISLTVHGSDGVTAEIEAIVDTGFNGELTLQVAVVEALGLTWLRVGRAMLADGSETLFDSYEATVDWDGAPRHVTVDAADAEPLVGMALLSGNELTVQAVPGGLVTITSLP